MRGETGVGQDLSLPKGIGMKKKTLTKIKALNTDLAQYLFDDRGDELDEFDTESPATIEEIENLVSCFELILGMHW